VAAAHAAFESLMAKTIIRRPFLRILQNVVCLVDFLELLFGYFAAGICIWMKLLCELAEGGLEFLFIRFPADTQNIVIVAFCNKGWAPPVSFSPPYLLACSGERAFRMPAGGALN
jgi:hypothetical protein